MALTSEKYATLDPMFDSMGLFLWGLHKGKSWIP